MADKIIENNQVSIMGKIAYRLYIQSSGLWRGLLYHGASCTQTE